MAYVDSNLNDPSLFFNTVLYTGDIVDGDGTGHDQVITGVGFEPNLLWHKGRNQARQHILVDSVRGTGGSPTQMLGIVSQDANAEISTNSNGWIESLDSDGFTVTSGDDSSSKSNNAGANTNTYVGWCWKETATAGFDIVGYTGTGSAKTESHSLSAVPNFMIVKNRGASSDWRVFTDAGGNGKWLQFNDTSAFQTASTIWNDTSPTSSVFSVGTSAGVNTDDVTYIAYLFANKQGFSKFGGYTGNGNADGTFVYTGFRPAFVLTKQTDGTDWWVINDTKRNTFNPTDLGLYVNVGNAETSDEAWTKDILSNGFKHRTTNSGSNGSGNTYIYMAFAESPFVNSEGVPTNAR